MALSTETASPGGIVTHRLWRKGKIKYVKTEEIIVQFPRNNPTIGLVSYSEYDNILVLEEG